MANEIYGYKENYEKVRVLPYEAFGVKQLLLNGDFQVWQRGESFNITGDEAFHYTADMWCVYASTGQTIKVDKTTDGLQFSGTSALMQRIAPLKTGKKYIFLAKVDGDVKTLQITGGTYTENSFLKYNKSGQHEQVQIKSNGITKVGNARLWEGTTIYPIVEEDNAIALMRTNYYIKNIITTVNTIYDYGNNEYGFYISWEEMYGKPIINIVNVSSYGSDGQWRNASTINVQTVNDRTAFVRCKFAQSLKNVSNQLVVNFIASCEPL